MPFVQCSTSKLQSWGSLHNISQIQRQSLGLLDCLLSKSWEGSPVARQLDFFFCPRFILELQQRWADCRLVCIGLGLLRDSPSSTWRKRQTEPKNWEPRTWLWTSSKFTKAEVVEPFFLPFPNSRCFRCNNPNSQPALRHNELHVSQYKSPSVQSCAIKTRRPDVTHRM